MEDLKSLVKQSIEGLQFMCGKTLEIARMTKESHQLFSELPKEDREKDFGTLGCDIQLQADMAVQGIDNPKEQFADVMKAGQESIKALIDAFDVLIPRAEKLFEISKDTLPDSGLRAVLDKAILYRNALKLTQE